MQQQDGLEPPAGRPHRALPRGDLLASLVMEYLEWAGLDYSRRVFSAEAGEEDAFPGRDALADQLGVSPGEGPILAAVLGGFGGAEETTAGARGGARGGGRAAGVSGVSGTGARAGAGSNPPPRGGSLAPIPGAKRPPPPVSAPAASNVIMSDDDTSADVEVEEDIEAEASGQLGGAGASKASLDFQREGETSLYGADDRSGSIDGLDETVDLVESAR